MSHQAQLESINRGILSIDESIQILKNDRQLLVEKRNKLLDIVSRNAIQTEHKHDSNNYNQTTFPWSQDLVEKARDHFGIKQFRELQLPILNAALDQKRDLFVVLPTGAGKSLCYQLPAVLENGFTLVISPLVSLIKDQVYHLQEANIPAAYLTGTSTKEQVNDIHLNMLPQKGALTTTFKLLYVTPEKIAKSKRFTARLNKAYDAGMLTRIVVDEAHCCSQQGHDFRPDYKQLNILRTLFPKTKIMALTATCPWSVMKDVMRILAMKQPQVKEGTLVFSAPLYRPNLVYRVVQRPDTAEETIRNISQWITQNYPNQSGIIYTLSKKDAEVVAQSIMKESKLAIRCGTYHADMDEEDKEYIHQKWRKKEIQVIVATIAFGMGINHLETRFIIHHCMSKSMEGYYQESGRAGRDGEKAECIIYYRGTDAVRLSSLVVGEVSGRTGLYEMIKYAQDYETCRKILFEKYFSLDRGGEGLVNKITPDQPCGICDNCTRSENTLVTRNIRGEAETVIRLCNLLKQFNERVTMIKLVQMLLGRGLGVIKSRVQQPDSKIAIPLDRNKYNEYDIERIINHLLVQEYLTEDFNFTPYNTITYIIVGPYGGDFITNHSTREMNLTFLSSTLESTNQKKRKLTQNTKQKPEYICLDDD